MQLHYADLSPFARKVRILLIEKGLDARVELITVNPYEASDALLAANPLSKVPTLVRDDGSVLYDSDVICEYLDTLEEPRLLPDTGDARLTARRRLALTDGILEATFNIACERNRRPENERSPNWIKHWGRAVGRGVAALEAEVEAFGPELTLPHIGAVCALDYVALRAPDLLDWRGTHPGLIAWYETFGERNAMRSTRPDP